MRAIAVSLVVLLVAGGVEGAAKKKSKHVAFDPALPRFGTRLSSLPEGHGKDLAETSCLPCHSSDILRQQRLTGKQWTATVEKMMRWGAVLKDDEKAELISYLAQRFGPENHFTPVRTRPIGY